MPNLIRTVIFDFIFLIYFIAGSAISWAVSLFLKDRSLAFRVSSKLWSHLLLFAGGIKVTVSGANNIPKNQAAIFISNHQSAVDIPILCAILPPFRFTPKKELFKIPFFGWYCRQADYLMVERESSHTAHKIINKAKKILAAGEYLHIFPEGTRSYDGSLGEFKRGSLFLAFHTGAPLVPVAISGSFNILPRGSLIIRPTKVKVTVGEPIVIEKKEGAGREDYEKTLAGLRKTILELLERHP